MYNYKTKTSFVVCLQHLGANKTSFNLIILYLSIR